MESRYMSVIVRFPPESCVLIFLDEETQGEIFCWGGGCYKLSDEQKSGRKKEEKKTFSKTSDVFSVGTSSMVRFLSPR